MSTCTERLQQANGYYTTAVTHSNLEVSATEWFAVHTISQLRNYTNSHEILPDEVQCI